jgi:hypothetical protein
VDCGAPFAGAAARTTSVGIWQGTSNSSHIRPSIAECVRA